MNIDNNWQVASLSMQDLQRLQQLEPQLKGSNGKDIVLIAYQKK